MKTINAGELIIIPRGVEHRPVAETDAIHLLLFDSASILNTGNLPNKHTVTQPERI